MARDYIFVLAKEHKSELASVAGEGSLGSPTRTAIPVTWLWIMVDNGWIEILGPGPDVQRSIYGIYICEV